MRRLARTIVVLLFVGAIINVAVAWGCAAWSKNTVAAKYSEQNGATLLLYIVAAGFGRTEVVCLRAYEPMRDIIENSKMPPTRNLPTWYGRTVPMQDNLWFKDYAMGWPFAALRMRVHVSWLDDRGWIWTEVEDEFLLRDLPLNQMPPAKMPLMFPCSAIWPGFAINTFFYATIIWLLVAAPGMIRRHFRSGRGRCLGCGYPIGTSPVCTECGAAVKPRVARPAP